METIEEYRGKGFAMNICAALIDYCIKNNYEPIWSCRLENIGSYKLAKKLGFELTLKLPYYRLSK
jgi:L-amino acid N-acyltransferase YncA